MCLIEITLEYLEKKFVSKILKILKSLHFSDLRLATFDIPYVVSFRLFLEWLLDNGTKQFHQIFKKGFISFSLEDINENVGSFE